MDSVLHYDIVIVGGGAAGLRAAIAVAEADPQLRVALVSKVYPMRSHTVSAEGGAAAVARADDSLEAHAYDTVKGSDFLGDQPVIQYSWSARRRNWCGWNTGAARGAATTTARWPPAPLAA